MDLLKKNALIFLALLHTLALDLSLARKYGGGGGGGGLGKIPGGGGAGENIARKPGPGSWQPAQYADSSKFDPASTCYSGRYSRYPNGGYATAAWTFLFLHGTHHRYNSGSDGNDYEPYFDRIENGCQLTSVASYRTIDNNNNTATGRSSTATGDDWVGCTEEWKYNVAVIRVGDSPDRVFVSPPVELYACDPNDACAECHEELRGADFDALALEAVDFSDNKDANDNPYVDCFVPKNRTLVDEVFDCYNDECIFLSEKDVYISSGAAAAAGAGFATALLLAMGGGIAMAACELLGQ